MCRELDVDNKSLNKWDCAQIHLMNFKKKIKSVDYFHTSWTPPHHHLPLPLKYEKFPEILRSKRVKKHQKTPF